jgi:hypothetical protein
MSNILDNILNLIEEVAAEQPQAPPPQGEGQVPPAPPPIKAPAKIKSFINKMVKDFGPEGSGKMDMVYMRKARETLGVPGGMVSKLAEKAQEGATPEDLILSIKKETDKF